MGRRAVALIALAAGAAYAWWRAQEDQAGGFYDPLDYSGAGGPQLDPVAPPEFLSGGGLVESYLRGRGLDPAVARGVAAGVWAESLADPTAVNPTSGAYGIGQWLGSRKAELFRRYGSRPSMAQQLDFLAWELGGGDHGGRAVLATSTPEGALDAYIRRFMRPAAGAETAGDLARGRRYLG